MRAPRPTPEAAPAPHVLITYPSNNRLDACPTCNAVDDEPCTTATGHHPGRPTPKGTP